MTEAERIQEVLYRFEYGGLIWKDPVQVRECLAETLLGIGLGEQGVVHSKEEVCRILEGTQKEVAENSHTIRCENIEITLHSQVYASLCAEVVVTAHSSTEQQESRFFQSLTLHKLEGDWKICALHASTPVISEEAIEAYPLKIAEKTLESLRKRIGEAVYQAEEQFRQAVLADTIAFYVINLTQDMFEKCQLNGDVCANVPEGTSMKRFIEDNVSYYVAETDVRHFLKTFSSESIEWAHQNGIAELACEYRLKLKNGGQMWAVSILRLITDAETGDRKGILYVRDISKSKQERAELLDRASRDGMTRLYNSATFAAAVDQLLDDAANDGAALVMLDVDDFKCVNDTYGHPVGDEVLIRIARVIQKFCSEQSWAGRIGGDEFSIFAPCAGGREWEAQVNTLWAAIASIRLPEAPALRVSCSIGVAYRRPQDRCFKDLYEKADKALYRSKKNGKGKITFYSPSCGEA